MNIPDEWVGVWVVVTAGIASIRIYAIDLPKNADWNKKQLAILIITASLLSWAAIRDTIFVRNDLSLGLMGVLLLFLFSDEIPSPRLSRIRALKAIPILLFVAIYSRVNSLAKEVDSLSGKLDNFDGPSLGSVESDLRSIESDIRSIQSDVSSIESDVSSIKIYGVRSKDY